MAKLFLLAVLVLVSSTLFAQKLQITDSKTGDAIEGVIVFTKYASTVSNERGFVDLSLFSDELIHFSHAAYLDSKAKKQTLWSLNYQVKLVEDPVKIDEILVSSNRRKQSRLEVPNQVVSINKNEILFRNPATTADLLDTEGGVFIQKSQMGGGSPMIRGFSANRLLLVVDGIRMNNAIYRNGNLHNVISLDPASLKQAEVVFGPGSVMYGSDALGGVLHFQTLSPELSTSELYRQSRHAFIRYASANSEKTAHVDFNVGNDRLATLLSLTVTDFDDLLMGKHGPSSYLRSEFIKGEQVVENPDPRRQIPTAYSQLNYMQKIRFRPDNNWDLTYAFHLSTTSDIPRYDRLIQNYKETLKYAEWYYGPQKWNMHSFDIRWNNKNWLFDHLTLLAGWQAYTESRHSRKFQGNELTSREEKLDILTINLDFDKQIDRNNNLFYGLEGNFNWLSSMGKIIDINTGMSRETSSRYPNGSNTSCIAAYASYKLSLNKKFTLNTGTRFSINQMEGQFDQRFFDFPTRGFENTHASVTGNVGLVYHPTKDWQLNLSASSGFRSPNIDDIAKVFDSSPGNLVVPNPNLNPEYVWSIETGIIRSIENLAKFELNAFYTFLDDAMVRRPFPFNGQDSILYEGELSRVEALVNADYAHIYGGDFSMKWILSSRWKTRHTITATFGEDSEGLPLRHVAPIFGKSQLIYQHRHVKLDLYLKYNGQQSNEKLALSEQEKSYLYASDENGNPYAPSWLTFNIKSSYDISDKYSLKLGIENILNKRYRPYSSGIVAPARNFIISLNAII